MSLEIKASKPYVWLKDEDTNKVIQVKNDAGDLKTIDELGNEVTINGVQITAHASRHDRGGADALNWSALTKYHSVSGVSASVGVSGSPATTTLLTLDTDYYNLLPLTVKVTPSGLGTSETLTISVVVKGSDGNTYTLGSKSGVNATVTFTQADFDFTVIPDGVRIVEIDVSIESSATSTSATATADVTALEM